MIFVSPQSLINKVRSNLKSFDAAGLIDEGDFYDWIKYILTYLNVSSYCPQMAIMELRNKKAALPSNFAYVYAGYELQPVTKLGNSHLIGGSIITIEKEVTGNCETITPCTELEEDCVINTKYFVEGSNMKFANPRLIRLSPQVSHVMVDGECLSLSSNSRKEFFISRNSKTITTNFDGWFMFMYYGFPVEEETGLPAIPENEIIQEAIEYYLMKRIMELWWLNSSAPDLERRLAAVTNTFDEKMGDAKLWVQTPSFQTLLNLGHRRRSLLDKYQLNTKQYW